MRESSAELSSNWYAGQGRSAPGGTRMATDWDELSATHAAPPVDELLAEQHEGHRARGEERPERNVLAPAPSPEGDQHHADDRAVQEPREQPAEDVPPAQPAEEQPEHEREPDVAEPHSPRRNEVQDEE